ncbi:MAG TPA: hypothetical protein VGO50_16810 [Pyrinomonadaceae bacterium]|jgi:hypothetical protein|nr:hypothetical protein [Pyrinomonadaceae bacterium]
MSAQIKSLETHLSRFKDTDELWSEVGKDFDKGVSEILGADTLFEANLTAFLIAEVLWNYKPSLFFPDNRKGKRKFIGILRRAINKLALFLGDHWLDLIVCLTILFLGYAVTCYLIKVITTVLWPQPFV